MRKHAKVDANQYAIVSAARRLGAFVTSLADVGGGTPDLLVIHNGRVMCWELKDGAQPPSKRRLTPDEQLWHADAAGIGGYCVPIVESVDDVVRELTSAAEGGRMIRGKLVVAGTMTVDGEELTGVFVECTREAILEAAKLPLYRDVVVALTDKEDAK